LRLEVLNILQDWKSSSCCWRGVRRILWCDNRQKFGL